MKLRLLTTLFLLMLLGFQNCAKVTEAQSQSLPLEMNLSGFKVRIAGRAVLQKNLPIAIQLLESQLKQIETLVPRIADLKNSVEFWITDSHWQSSAMVYHPSAEWLAQHSMDPQMAKGVEIVDINAFINVLKTDTQPMIVLHELAHAYHHQILKANSPEIHFAFKNAVSQGIYETAYAMTNEQEYFAELTEAFYGKNDYFPFTRFDLKSFDPTGFQALQGIWEL